MNRFLLIDFGASYIKSALYSKEFDFLEKPQKEVSPLYHKTKLSKYEIREAITSVLQKYERVDAVVMCSILGGNYEHEIYYSWKDESSKKETTGSCLLSELFRDQETYHVHNNHCSESNTTGLSVLGYLNGIKFYSSLGDTHCVAQSLSLQEDELLINLGTGSQVIRETEGYEIVSFIPSGRALNIFYNFFKTLGLDLFEEFKKLSFEDLENSTLSFDLNTFPEAYKFNGGGVISGIAEDSFNVHNFIASLFKSYLTQYVDIINDYENINTVYLAGGISRKYKLISEYISRKTQVETVVRTTSNEDTHIGMCNLIRKYL